MEILKHIFLLFFEERQWTKLIGIVHDLFDGNIFNQIAILSLIASVLFLAACIFVIKGKKEIFRVLSIAFYMFFLINAMVLGRPSGERVFTIWTIDMFYSGKVFHETSIILAILKLMIFIPLGAIIFARVYKRENWKKCIVFILAIPTFTETSKYILAKGVPSLGGIFVHFVGGLIGFFIGHYISKRRYLVVE